MATSIVHVRGEVRAGYGISSLRTVRELVDRLAKVLKATNDVCKRSSSPEVLLLEAKLFSDYVQCEQISRSGFK